MKKNYMAIDQYGQTYHNLGSTPRKSLVEKIGVSHVEKMYCDKRDGSSVWVGYIISGLWLNLYEVTPFERPM